MMKRSFWGAWLVLFLVACSSPTSPVSVAGTWTGTFSKADRKLGVAILELKQDGLLLTGQATFKAMSCIETADLEGSVSGEQLDLTIAYDQESFELTGAVTAETISGVFRFSGRCAFQNGTFVLEKGVTDAKPDPDLNPVGTWQGKLRGDFGLLTMSLERYSDALVGDVYIQDSDCLDYGFLYGEVKNNRLTAEITLQRKVIRLRGTFKPEGFTGSFSLAGSCSAGSGNLKLLKVEAEAMLTAELRYLLAQQRVQALQLGPDPAPAKVALGQMLMFDKLLSGNRDIACATCHHAKLQTADQLSLSIGTGGTGLGASRTLGAGRSLVPRHAPDVFNRGLPGWDNVFWDGRVSGSASEGFISPAGERLPAGLENLLAVQAMFPVTVRGEMRGEVNDLDVNGQINELAVLDDADLPAIWSGLMQRLLAIEEYRQLFAAAYPTVPETEFGFQHAANAIAAFEMSAWTTVASPFDAFLVGNDVALSDAAKRGGILFYGDAACSTCHSGALFTDQTFHNIAVPQLGPGKDEDGLDMGRYLQTSVEADKFAFRTPSLRNVAITAPYMHNGAFTSLEQVILHYNEPIDSLYAYTGSQLEPSLKVTVKRDRATKDLILETLSPQLPDNLLLTQQQMDDLKAFLEALTDPKALHLEDTIPASVPSGLPVD